MLCEICEGKTRVINTRTDVDHVVRKRMCLKCGHIFYTQEIDMDYKTGKKPDSPEKSAQVEHYRKQLEIYAYRKKCEE